MNFLLWLALLFIALKLTGFVAWSWWLVLSPIWVPIFLVFAAFVGLLVLFVIIYGLAFIFGEIR